MDKSSDTPAQSNHLGELRRLVERGREVWKLVPQKRKRALGLATLIMVAISVGNTYVALLLGGLVDGIQSGLKQESSNESLYWAAGRVLLTIAVIYLAREILNVVRRSLVSKSCIDINRDMQTHVVDHLMKIDLNLLSQERIGTLHGKIFRSVDGFVRFVRLMFLDCLPAFATGLFALIAAVLKQPILGLVMTGVVPLAVFLTLRQLATQKGVRLELMRDCEEIDGIVVEQLSGAEYIRVAHTLPQEMQRLSAATERRCAREIKHHFAMALFGCAKALNEGLFHIIVLGMATYFAMNRQISFGDVLTFSVLFLSVMTPLNEIHRVIDEGHEASLCLGDLLDMLRIPIDRAFETESRSCAALKHGEPAIIVEDLRFEYMTTDGIKRHGLDGIFLRINHGETIGVAGRSGSGKSTWIKALLRTIHPTSGRITIAGVALEDFGRTEIAGLVGYVGQNPFIFSGTICENIAYGNGTVDQEAIHRAVELANLKEEIEAMPLGYETLITERGQNLSGGQRQRIAIARILLKQAPLLVLDEATSALDNISERNVQRALGITNQDRTTIMVAHRLTTLKDCDRILVFDNGQIVEEGDYETLVNRGGLFAELVASGEHGVSPADEARKRHAD